MLDVNLVKMHAFMINNLDEAIYMTNNCVVIITELPPASFAKNNYYRDYVNSIPTQHRCNPRILWKLK